MASIPARLGWALTLAAASLSANAAAVKAPNTPGIKWMMCDEPGNAVKFRAPQGTTDLIIACTKTETNLTLKGCHGPRVQRINGVYVITCEKLEVRP